MLPNHVLPSLTRGIREQRHAAALVYQLYHLANHMKFKKHSYLINALNFSTSLMQLFPSLDLNWLISIDKREKKYIYNNNNYNNTSGCTSSGCVKNKRTNIYKTHKCNSTKQRLKGTSCQKTLKERSIFHKAANSYNGFVWQHLLARPSCAFSGSLKKKRPNVYKIQEYDPTKQLFQGATPPDYPQEQLNLSQNGNPMKRLFSSVC